MPQILSHQWLKETNEDDSDEEEEQEEEGKENNNAVQGGQGNTNKNDIDLKNI